MAEWQLEPPRRVPPGQAMVIHGPIVRSNSKNLHAVLKLHLFHMYINTVLNLISNDYNKHL